VPLRHGNGSRLRSQTLVVSGSKKEEQHALHKTDSTDRDDQGESSRARSLL
jgi:hypothetical protein